ncbi:hypothetical protein QGN29_02765 [Temperatibacter marinus]|uniref:Uncharacterized protein n=1 Tax=Temperatibacter marinus TaxID=1456591 RepID=A0AA52HB11_9PROT|nr:hypothetical protein [Temperatibacter marinus]WND03290.1 hypothetical protein QGN29_02765 [Temperatibacter marinus]
MIDVLSFHWIKRTVFFGLALWLILGQMAIAQNTANNELETELLHLEQEYKDLEMKLQAQLTELDRILNVGYSGVSLRKDMLNIVERVQTLDLKLKDLETQLAALVKLAAFNPVKPFEIIVRKSSKTAPAIMTDVRAGDIVYFTSEVPHPTDKNEQETLLQWSLILPDGRVSDTLLKTDQNYREGRGALYSFGIDTKGMELGKYQVKLAHSIPGNTRHKFEANTQFEINIVDKLIVAKMVVDDERTGDKHMPVLPSGASPYLFTYYEVPSGVDALTAHYSVHDLTSNKNIYNRVGRRNTKPDMDIQRVGVLLDPKTIEFVDGHEYRFDINLEDNLRPARAGKKYKSASKSIRFFYGNEPRYAKIEKLFVATRANAEQGDGKIPLLKTPLYLLTAVKAASALEKIAVDFRLTAKSNGDTVFASKLSHEINSKTDRIRISVPVKSDLLTENEKYTLQATITADDVAPQTKTYSFTYAASAPVDLRSLISIKGVISTPGLPDVPISNLSSAKYFYRDTSTISFNVPAVLTKGLNGSLNWSWRNCMQSKSIPLDGSVSDWGVDISPGSSRCGGPVELIYKRTGSESIKLYSAIFAREQAFSASVFTSAISRCGYKPGCKDDKVSEAFYPWGLGNVGIKISNNSFPTNVTVSVDGKIQGSGQSVYTANKKLSLKANEKKEWVWDLNPNIFKFDFESLYPNIQGDDVEKTVEFKVTIDDGVGKKRTLTRSLSRQIYVLNNKTNVKKASKSEGTTLVASIQPPTGMRAPYKSKITGISAYYMDGLNWHYDPEKLDEWIVQENVPKIGEDAEKSYYRKTVPLLLTIEDADGKQALLFYTKYTYTVSLYKNNQDDE